MDFAAAENGKRPPPDRRRTAAVRHNHTNRPEGEPPQREPPRSESPDFKLSTFYSVAFSEDGEVLAVDDSERDVYSGQELIGVAKQILNVNQKTGQRDSLAFRVSEKGGYTLVAFMDNTVADSGMDSLLHRQSPGRFASSKTTGALILRLVIAVPL